MKLINKHKSLDEYYSAQPSDVVNSIEKHVFVPYNSTPSSEIEVFNHPTEHGHTFVGFSSMNHVSKDDPILEHQYSMTHLDENHQLVNYKSVLLNESSPSEIANAKMELFDSLNFQHLVIKAEKAEDNKALVENASSTRFKP